VLLRRRSPYFSPRQRGGVATGGRQHRVAAAQWPTVDDHGARIGMRDEEGTKEYVREAFAGLAYPTKA